MTVANRIKTVLRAFERYADAIEADPWQQINQRLERLEAEVFSASSTDEEPS